MFPKLERCNTFRRGGAVFSLRDVGCQTLNGQLELRTRSIDGATIDRGAPRAKSMASFSLYCATSRQAGKLIPAFEGLGRPNWDNDYLVRPSS